MHEKIIFQMKWIIACLQDERKQFFLELFQWQFEINIFEVFKLK